MFKLQQQKKDDDNILLDDNSIAPDNEDKDTTNDEDKDDNGHADSNDDDDVTDSDRDGDDSSVHDDRVLASCFVLIAWGQFAPTSDRLETLMTSDDKKVPKSTTATRKASERENKDNERACGSSTVRGFSTDQRTNVEQLRVQKMSCIDRKNEKVVINLAIEESALVRQVETSEVRIKICCPTCKASNLFWKNADATSKKHDESMGIMS